MPQKLPIGWYSEKMTGVYLIIRLNRGIGAYKFFEITHMTQRGGVLNPILVTLDLDSFQHDLKNCLNSTCNAKRFASAVESQKACGKIKLRLCFKKTCVIHSRNMLWLAHVKETLRKIHSFFECFKIGPPQRHASAKKKLLKNVRKNAVLADVMRGAKVAKEILENNLRIDDRTFFLCAFGQRVRERSTDQNLERLAEN